MQWRCDWMRTRNLAIGRMRMILSAGRYIGRPMSGGIGRLLTNSRISCRVRGGNSSSLLSNSLGLNRPSQTMRSDFRRVGEPGGVSTGTFHAPRPRARPLSQRRSSSVCTPRGGVGRCSPTRLGRTVCTGFPSSRFRTKGGDGSPCLLSSSLRRSDWTPMSRRCDTTRSACKSVERSSTLTTDASRAA